MAPISTYKWVDRNSATWESQPGQSGTSIARELREHIGIDIWYKASHHYCGSGLGMGADLTVLSRHIAWFRKKDRHKDAAFLTTKAAEGISPQKRIAHGGKKIDTICPRCKKEDQTLLHLFLACRYLATGTDPRIRSTQHLKTTAYRYSETKRCFWGRGSTAKGWTHRVAIEEEQIWDIGDTDLELYFRRKKTTFSLMDQRVPDPRTQGPGLVGKLRSNRQHYPLRSWNPLACMAPLRGPQIVSISELAALIRCLTFILQGRIMVK